MYLRGIYGIIIPETNKYMINIFIKKISLFRLSGLRLRPDNYTRRTEGFGLFCDF